MAHLCGPRTKVFKFTYGPKKFPGWKGEAARVRRIQNQIAAHGIKKLRCEFRWRRIYIVRRRMTTLAGSSGPQACAVISAIAFTLPLPLVARMLVKASAEAGGFAASTSGEWQGLRAAGLRLLEGDRTTGCVDGNGEGPSGSRASVGGAGQDFWEDFERRKTIYVLWTAIPNPKTSGWGRAGMPSGQKTKSKPNPLN